MDKNDIYKEVCMLEYMRNTRDNILQDIYKSKDFFEEILRISKSFYGEIHPEISKIIYKLSYVYCLLGDQKQAESILNGLLEKQKEFYNSDSSPEIGETLLFLADTKIAFMGSSSEIGNYANKAKEIFKTHYNELNEYRKIAARILFEQCGFYVFP